MNFVSPDNNLVQIISFEVHFSKNSMFFYNHDNLRHFHSEIETLIKNHFSINRFMVKQRLEFSLNERDQRGGVWTKF